MKTYMYQGPVVEFGRVVQEKYSAKTQAETSGRARSNLMYRWKKENNRLPSAKVALPGKLVEVA